MTHRGNLLKSFALCRAVACSAAPKNILNENCDLLLFRKEQPTWLCCVRGEKIKCVLLK